MPGTSNAATVVNEVWLSRRRADQQVVSIGKRPAGEAIRMLHLVDTLNVGGTENQMAQTVLRLHSARHPVTVGCLRAEGPLLKILQQAGIPVVEFRKEKTLLSPGGIYQLLRLAIFLRRKKVRVLHAHDLWANLLGVPAARLAGTPVIISSRRYLADLEWYKPWRNKVIRAIYRLSTHVVVNSNSVRETLARTDGLSPQKLRVIYNGVDVDRYANARQDRKGLLPGVGSRPRLIAVVANMYSPVKGHHHLIPAASIVCRALPETIFLLIGDGKERPKLEQHVREAGLEKNILFLGHRCDIPELLACCYLSVLPSEAEAMPNSILEAMASGLPVVATAVGGATEVIENEVTGLLAPTKNPQALAAAILRMLHDPHLAMSLGRAGQERMRTHFSFQRLTTELEQLYSASSLHRKHEDS